jgi:transcriptional regulator with XRE-family HTH domain
LEVSIAALRSRFDRAIRRIREAQKINQEETAERN